MLASTCMIVPVTQEVSISRLGNVLQSSRMSQHLFNLRKKYSSANVFSGIYVPNDERWPEHFRGIGIRIEDSVCVGDENPIVLTTEAVKEIDDIEALRS